MSQLTPRRRCLPARVGAGRLFTLVAVVVAFVTAAGAAYGYFTLSGSGSASSLAKTLAAPGTGSVGTPGAVSLPLTWVDSANLPGSGGTPDGYKVFRSTTSGSQGAAVPSSSTCFGTNGFVAQTTTSTSCTDSGLVPNTTYYYEVAAGYDSWLSPANTQFSATTAKQATTSVLSGISPTTGTAGTTSFSATATVTGNSGYGTPAGSVVFSLYTSSTCSGAPVSSTAGVTLSSGSATGSLTPNAAGTYYWGAAYTPSDTVNVASSGCSGTSITVTTATLGTVASLVDANHGSTPGKVEQSDTITVVFSQAMNASSLCAAWPAAPSTTQTLSGLDVTLTQASSSVNTSINVGNAANANICGTGHAFKFGSIDLGAVKYDGSGNNSTEFTSSTVSYNPTTKTLVITLGTASGTTPTPVTTATQATYVPDSNVLTSGGNQLATFKQGTAVEQF